MANPAFNILSFAVTFLSIGLKATKKTPHQGLFPDTAITRS
jgi:hypothetical protein